MRERLGSISTQADAVLGHLERDTTTLMEKVQGMDRSAREILDTATELR